MRIGNKSVQMFKIKNRSGYGAVCFGCLTEGRTPNQAYDRMVKAIRRVTRKKK